MSVACPVDVGGTGTAVKPKMDTDKKNLVTVVFKVDSCLPILVVVQLEYTSNNAHPRA